MPLSVDEAEASTKSGLLSLGMKEEDLDLSYITDELLSSYANANEKDIPDTSLMQNAPYFWGNSLVHISGNRWSYKNGNSNTGADLQVHKCGTKNSWNATTNSYPYSSCPGSSPSEGFYGNP